MSSFQALKDKMKEAMTPDQAASFRMMLARFGRRAGTGLEELWLHKLAQAGQIKTFIQIGANDGDEKDPIASIIRRYQLSGVLIEPIPFFCDKLRQRYKNRPDVTVVNTAIADEGEASKPFYHLALDDPSLPAWANGLGSFNRDVIISHADRIPDIETKIVATTVPCLSFADLTVRCNLVQVDVIITDTEGYDFQILRQVNFRALQPKLVIFERKHLSPEEQRLGASLFTGNGYRCIDTIDNTIAVRNDVADRWHTRS